MKVVHLRVENVKRIKMVEITPEGNTVVIAGKNGAGKSSVLDALMYAVGGKDAAKGVKRPIRDGAERAEVRVDLGDLVVTRVWQETDTWVRVESGNARYSSPQAVLDSLLGKLSFDPLAFLNESAKQQVETLLGVAVMEVDPRALDAARAANFAERTEIGREVRKLEGRMSGLTEPQDGLPLEEIDSAEVVLQIQEANRVIAANAEERRLYDAGTKDVARIDDEIQEAERRLADMRKRRGELARSLLPMAAKVADLKDPDLNALNETLANLAETNRAIRAANEYRQVKGELDAAQGEYARLTQAIAEVDEQKERVLREATMPVEGLSFDAEGVTYKGVPLKQASAAEQLRVSVAMAMAANPKLKVILVRDASLLDRESTALLTKLAEDNDYQLWMERVDETGAVGIQIEDGRVVP